MDENLHNENFEFPEPPDFDVNEPSGIKRMPEQILPQQSTYNYMPSVQNVQTAPASGKNAGKAFAFISIVLGFWAMVCCPLTLNDVLRDMRGTLPHDGVGVSFVPTLFVGLPAFIFALAARHKGYKNPISMIGLALSSVVLAAMLVGMVVAALNAI